MADETITIEGYHSPDGPMITFVGNGVEIATYPLSYAREFALRLLAAQFPPGASTPVETEKAEQFAREILAVCDVLAQQGRPVM